MGVCPLGGKEKKEESSTSKKDPSPPGIHLHTRLSVREWFTLVRECFTLHQTPSGPLEKWSGAERAAMGHSIMKSSEESNLADHSTVQLEFDQTPEGLAMNFPSDLEPQPLNSHSWNPSTAD